MNFLNSEVGCGFLKSFLVQDTVFLQPRWPWEVTSTVQVVNRVHISFKLESNRNLMQSQYCCYVQQVNCLTNCIALYDTHSMYQGIGKCRETGNIKISELGHRVKRQRG